MPARPRKIPKPRTHATGQLVATFNGKDEYFGKADTPEAQAAYDRFVAEWLASGRGVISKPNPAVEPKGPSVNEVALAYVRHAEEYYVKNGSQTREVWAVKASLRVARELYGLSPAAEFGPLALKACRERFLQAELSRSECNRRARHIVRCFRWAVAEELIPSPVLHALRAVAGLKKGRTKAREDEPVEPVPDEFVDAVRPYVSRQVWAMIELQRLTGMRPGEAVAMRTRDVAAGGQVWVYTPESHKTEHHGRRRTIYIGPKAQAVLEPWLRTNLEEPLFQPIEAERERKEAMRAARASKVQPSQMARRLPAPKKKPGIRYTVDSYRRAITYGCKRANEAAAVRGADPGVCAVPNWGPNRLRHNAGTRFRKEFGLDVAQVLLGHSSANTTEIYAELDRTKAAQAIAKVG